MEWYLKVLKNYANFNGRARRKEYWMFVLFNIIASIVVMVLDNVLGTNFKIDSGFGQISMPYGYLFMLYHLGVFIPSLAVGVRRLHDIGKSGWALLIGIIPLIGGIWLLVLVCSEGNAEENKYGPNPKEIIDGGVM